MVVVVRKKSRGAKRTKRTIRFEYGISASALGEYFFEPGVRETYADIPELEWHPEWQSEEYAKKVMYIVDELRYDWIKTSERTVNKKVIDQVYNAHRDKFKKKGIKKEHIIAAFGLGLLAFVPRAKR